MLTYHNLNTNKLIIKIRHKLHNLENVDSHVLFINAVSILCDPLCNQGG